MTQRNTVFSILQHMTEENKRTDVFFPHTSLSLSDSTIWLVIIFYITTKFLLASIMSFKYCMTHFHVPPELNYVTLHTQKKLKLTLFPMWLFS